MTRIPNATRCERSFTEIAWQTREANSFIADFRAGTDVAQAIVMANEQTVTTVSKTNPAVRAILAACFPQWRGRKVRLVVGGAVRSHASDWDGNTRCESRFYSLRDGGVVYVDASGRSTRLDVGSDCPDGWCVVERDTFCGKDAGVTIRVARSLDLVDLAVAVDALLEGKLATVTAQALVADRVLGGWGGKGLATALSLAWLEVEATAVALAKSQAKAGRDADRTERLAAELSDSSSILNTRTVAA